MYAGTCILNLIVYLCFHHSVISCLEIAMIHYLHYITKLHYNLIGIIVVFPCKPTTVTYTVSDDNSVSMHLKHAATSH